MLKVYTKLCKDIDSSFNTNGTTQTMEKFFQFPKREDILYVICVKLHSLILRMPEVVDPVVMKISSKLRGILENPEILANDNAPTSSEELVRLLTTQQLQGYNTTSVKYVDGVLRYCIAQPLEDMLFSKQLVIDRHTTCFAPMQVIKQLIKVQTKEDTVTALNDRMKILKKIAAIAPDLETDLGIVIIDRKGARLKTDVKIESGVTHVLIN